LITSLALIAGCSNLDLDPQPALIHARFDPDARVIPMPTDVLRDAALGRLELPNDTAEEKAKLQQAAWMAFTSSMGGDIGLDKAAKALGMTRAQLEGFAINMLEATVYKLTK